VSIGSGEEDQTDPILVDDVDDDDEPAVVLAVVHKGHPPDLDIPVERLQKHDNKPINAINQHRQGEGEKLSLSA
jgi:hypothetical protein